MRPAVGSAVSASRGINLPGDELKSRCKRQERKQNNRLKRAVGASKLAVHLLLTKASVCFLFCVSDFSSAVLAQVLLLRGQGGEAYIMKKILRDGCRRCLLQMLPRCSCNEAIVMWAVGTDVCGEVG